MPRLNSEKQEKLEPKRMEAAKAIIQHLGYYISQETQTSLTFDYGNSPVTYFPYSGWASGKSIKDGRGLAFLVKQIFPLSVGQSIVSKSKYSNGMVGIVWQISDYGVHVRYGTEGAGDISFQVFHFAPYHHMQTSILDLTQQS